MQNIRKSVFCPYFYKSPLILFPWDYFLFFGAKNGFSDFHFSAFPNLEILLFRILQLSSIISLLLVKKILNNK